MSEKDLTGALTEGLKRYLDRKSLAALANAKVGIAGAGGLGSNVAMMLARSGIRRMVIIDYDSVEPSNLNRQHYWPRHLGRKKVEALGEILRELDADMELDLLDLRLTAENMRDILPTCPIWVEALDDAASKALLTEKALLMGRKIAAASGLCGFGGEPMRKKRMGNLILVGDFVTGTDQAPPMAPRVVQAAALLSDCVLEFVLPAKSDEPFLP